jgi:hypothetical protein
MTSSKFGHLALTNTGASATNAVTGLGFKPGVIILWHNEMAVSTDTITDPSHLSGGFGFATSPTNRACIGKSAGGSGSTNRRGEGRIHDNACIIFLNQSAGLDGRVDLQSFDSGGFTLVNDAALTAAYRVFYIAIPQGIQANIVFHAIPNATGNTDTNGVGFQGNVGIMIGSGKDNTSYNASVSRPGYTIGMFKSGTEQKTMSGADEYDAGANQCRARTEQNTASAFRMSHYAGTTPSFEQCFFSTWLSDGFRVNWTTNNFTAGTKLATLVMDMDEVFVGHLATVNTLNADLVASGFGFAPKAAFTMMSGFSWNGGAADDTCFYGGFSSTSSRGVCGWSRNHDSGNNGDASIGLEFDQACAFIINAGGGWAGEYDVQSMDSGGFTLNVDNPDANIPPIHYIAFGDVVSGSNYMIIIMSKIREAYTKLKKKLFLPRYREVYI